MKDKKKPYESPRLTVVTFKTERGYAASLKYLTLGLLSGSNQEDYGMQDYEVQDNESWF